MGDQNNQPTEEMVCVHCADIFINLTLCVFLPASSKWFVSLISLYF